MYALNGAGAHLVASAAGHASPGLGTLVTASLLGGAAAMLAVLAVGPLLRWTLTASGYQTARAATATDLAAMPHLSDEERAVAEQLRERIAHLAATDGDGSSCSPCPP